MAVDLFFVLSGYLIGTQLFGAFVRGVASIVDIAVQVPIGLALACFFVWVGIYGIAGRYRGAGFPYRLADTKWLYRRRKKRYGWRW